MLIQSKVVRQNPQRLQALEAERNAHDRRLMHAIYEGVHALPSTVYHRKAHQT